jgi:hypothetical protein
MATVAIQFDTDDAEGRFIRTLAGLMVLVLVAGFSVNLALGRSSFDAPLLVHVHAFVFFGWAFLFGLQSRLGTRGPVALHRRLGWIGAAWLAVMPVLGVVLMVSLVRKGAAPPFFEPRHFLIANCLILFLFAVLAAAAIRKRRETDWHWRLHIGAMAALLGPGFGRLLPMPLLVPFAFEVTNIAGAALAIVGMIRDLKREGRIHPAWWWSVGGIAAVLALAQILAHSPLGATIYGLAMGAPQPG